MNARAGLAALAVSTLLAPATVFAQWDTAADPAATPAATPAAVPIASGSAGATAAAEAPPENAWLIQARMQTQPSIFGIAGGTAGFVLGKVMGGFAIGVGLGLTRLAYTYEGSGGITGTIFQVVPTGFFDLWQSANGNTKVDFVGSVGYGQASLTVESEEETCDYYYDPPDCSTDTTETESSATLIPVAVGIGGNHFLGPNFALGAELGLQMLFVTGVESEGDSIDAEISSQAFYGLFRMSILIPG